jgi:hypothetical protein
VIRGSGPLHQADHPLAGALDRLLARERGDRRAPPQGSGSPAITPTATAGAPDPLAAGAAPSAIAPAVVPASLRRMQVIAALGPDEGRAALRAVARWGVRHGRRPAALDLGCGARAPGDTRSPGPAAPRGDTVKPAGSGVPWASLPCGPERMRAEPPEVIAALLARLRHHETAADLLIVRIPPRPRMTLMRAALLAGGVILPLDDSEEVQQEACRLSREVVENFIDLTLWPVTEHPRALERYLATMRDFLGTEPRPLEMSTGPAILDNLPGAPEEGFIAALLCLDGVSPPSPLLHAGMLRL